MGGKKWGARLAMFAMMGFAAACAGGDEPDEAELPDASAEAPAAGAPAAPTAANLPPEVTPEMVQQGQQIFTSTGNCFTCHGMDGKGTTLAPNLTDGTWLNVTNAGDRTALYHEIAGVVKSGVATPKEHPAPMPAMGGATLSDDQVNQVAAYVISIAGG